MSKLNWWETACIVCIFCATATVGPAQQSFRTLVSFGGANGALPAAGLVQGLDGNLYGTSSYGGANGEGTVFRITPTGALTTLYSFCSQSNCTDGELPQGALVQSTDGNFYGITSYGGGSHSVGTVFRITPTGKLTTLYAFCAQTNCTDGSFPNAALVHAADANFYGTTYEGGANGGGTVFRITPTGALTTLYSFCSQSNCTDGELPRGALVQATDGNFYGTTYQGGDNGNGSVFKITSAGTLTTLYSFCSESNCTVGFEPAAGLVQGHDGDFYGTTSGPGANYYGTVFKITPTGAATALYDFCPQDDCSDGSSPDAGLVMGTDGNFYGTTFTGGANNDGTAFRITPQGRLTTLHSFDGNDGALPIASVVQDTGGALYGTAQAGGANHSCTYSGGCGTVFSLSVGLGPFLETRLTSGKVGATAKILGTNLNGASSVTFNGTAASFKVVSGSLISTTVPNGATTGRVQVVTPSGTLTSNVNFQVLP